MKVLWLSGNRRRTGYPQRLIDLFRRGLSETPAESTDVVLLTALQCVGFKTCRRQICAHDLAGQRDQAAKVAIPFERVGAHANLWRALAGREEDLHPAQATAAVNPPSTTIVWPMI